MKSTDLNAATLIDGSQSEKFMLGSELRAAHYSPINRLVASVVFSVVVTIPDGQSASKPFNPSPVVLLVSNNSGPAAGGSFFTIFGSNFAAGTTVTVTCGCA